MTGMYPSEHPDLFDAWRTILDPTCTYVFFIFVVP